MKNVCLFLALVFGVCAAQQPENPTTAVIPKPIYKMTPVEEKLYRKMLADRREIEKKFTLKVVIEGTHAKQQSGVYLKGVDVRLGNYFFAEGTATPVVAPFFQTVELKASGQWYTNAEFFSLYCNNEWVTDKCMELPPGTYLAKRGRRFWRDKHVEILQIPILMPGGKAIGGIHTTRRIVLDFLLLPFDPNRLRK